MTREVIFLTLEQILYIHEEQIERHGGSHGLRDLGLLESAVLRPQTTFGGVDLYKTVFDKSASLMHSLLLNHPFVDGNKRTAVVAALTFLELNGYRVKVANDTLVRFALSIENEKLPIEKIKAWFKKHAKKPVD